MCVAEKDEHTSGKDTTGEISGSVARADGAASNLSKEGDIRGRISADIADDLFYPRA